MTIAGAYELATARQVRLQPLHLRDEGEEWIVGRIDTGRFVALPAVGVRVIELLRDGHSVAAVTAEVSAEQGETVDVAGFTAALIDLGFVAQIDGQLIAGAEPVKQTFPWLRPQFVRWSLHPALWAACISMGIAAIAVYFLVPGEPIRSSDLVWSHTGSLVLVSLIVLGWGSIFLHELGHLITARAAGVPGKISLGTRLQFLAAQTDVSGIWSAPRRIRIMVYLSGMMVNVVLAATGVLLTRIFAPGAIRTFGAVLCMEQLLLLAGQFMFFMRTDIYFLVQDIGRCRDLYGDATKYVRYLAQKIAGRDAADPSTALSHGERRNVRLYSAFFVPGTLITLLVFVTVTLPVVVRLIGTALSHIASDRSISSDIDALVVLIALTVFYCIYVRVWWSRHKVQVTGFVHRRRVAHDE